MNVGIIVYSHTGNTLSVAQKLERALRDNGHSASIERLEPVNDNPNSTPVALKSNPGIEPYDALVFASPVQAFSLAPAMKLYLSQLSGLEGKKAYCFVTQQLKKPWLGGNHAVSQIRSACKKSGADITAGYVVNWSSDKREEQIDNIVKNLGAI